MDRARRRSATVSLVAIGTFLVALLLPCTPAVARQSHPTRGVVLITDGSSLGSGFFTAPGEIVTANHVVKGEDSAEIVYGSERDEGLVVARDVDADLAIIRTELKGSPLALRIGKPDVGADVRAVGYPEGSLSVTQGIVSGFRSLDGFTYLQTDAAVNGGSSGGPLIDSSGRVVGVIVSKVENAEGLAYAVPADVVRKLSASVVDRPSRDQPLALPSDRRMPPPAGRSQVWWLFLPLTLGLGAILARRSRRSSEQRRHHIVISKHDLG